MITVGIAVENALDRSKRVEAEALVDTGATYLTLPKAWRDRFGEFEKEKPIQIELANQNTYDGTLCAPVRIEVGEFEPVYTEVLFIEMEPNDGKYEPLLGCIPLETGRLAVDLDSNTLVSLKHAKLK